MKRAISTTGAIVLVLLGLTACDGADLKEACVTAGFCEPDPPDPELVTVVCDFSSGSSCNRDSLRETVESLLGHIINAPGSRVEIWTLGQDVASTERVAVVTIMPTARSGLRAIEAEQQRHIEDALYEVSRAIQPYMDGPAPGKSLLLSALGKAGLLNERPVGSWHVTMISDGLVFGEAGTDFECSPERDPMSLVERVHEAGILIPRSLQGAHVIFAYQTLDAIDGNRCPVEIGRVRHIREIWTSLLTAAGAESITFHAAAPLMESLAHADEPLVEGSAP